VLRRRDRHVAVAYFAMTLTTSPTRTLAAVYDRPAEREATNRDDTVAVVFAAGNRSWRRVSFDPRTGELGAYELA
jgi:hypothetical protein